MKTIIGIDPGAGGGIAVFKKGYATAVNMPKTDELNRYLKTLREENEDIIVFIEKVNSFRDDKKEGGKSFGIDKMLAQYAELLTLLKINNLPYCEVYPISWQSHLGLARRGVEKSIRKGLYKEYAQKTFPEVKVNLKTSDALCIVQFGRDKTQLDMSWVLERIKNGPNKNLFN